MPLLAIGAYTHDGNPGIRIFRWDPVAATLVPLAEHGGLVNPTWLARHPRLPVLYAVNEAQGGAVTALALDPMTGDLTAMGSRPTDGAGTCHLDLDPFGRLLAAVNYGSGSLALFPLDVTGAIGPAVVTIAYAGSGPHPTRQTRPHAHQALFSPDGGRLYVTDLGTDSIHVYAVGDAGFENIAVTAVVPGAGPRHLVFDTTGRRAWLANELANSVTVFAVDDDGRLAGRETIPTLPAGFTGENTVAAIRHDAAEERLYVSNRGHDSVAVFAVDGSGLTPLGHRPTGAAQPRDLVLDLTGRFLLAACQTGNAVTALRLDATTPPVVLIATPRPVCLCWLAG